MITAETEDSWKYISLITSINSWDIQTVEKSLVACKCQPVPVCAFLLHLRHTPLTPGCSCRILVHCIVHVPSPIFVQCIYNVASIYCIYFLAIKHGPNFQRSCLPKLRTNHWLPTSHHYHTTTTTTTPAGNPWNWSEVLTMLMRSF